MIKNKWFLNIIFSALLVLEFSSCAIAKTFTEQEIAIAQTELIEGITGNNIVQVKKAIKKGAIIDYYYSDGRTPLIFSIGRDCYDIFLLLLEKGADVNLTIKGEFGSNYFPMHVAAINNRVKYIKPLLDKGADINCLERYKLTPLDLAVREKSSEMVNLLIQNGADYSNITLHNVESVIIAQLLINYGANVNAWQYGYTALHVAVQENYSVDIVEFLIKNGADVNAKTKEPGSDFGPNNQVFPKGSTPLDIAKVYYTQQLINLLKKYGAK